MNQNIIIISINRKMPIKILTSNNRIIIKENFAVSGYYEGFCLNSTAYRPQPWS